MASLYDNNVYRFRHSVLPLGLSWLGGFAALAWLELGGWVPRWVLLLATAPAALFALLHAFHSVTRVIWAVRTYGRHLPGFMRRMIGLLPKLARFRYESAKLALHLGLAALGFVLVGTLGLWALFWPSAFLLGVGTTALLRVVLPPGGVYLTSSNPECIRFFGALNKRTISGIAALLEVSNLLDPNREGFVSGVAGALTDFRTTDPEDWPEVVKELIEMAAVVVVDDRDESPGVELEVRRILANRVEFKAAFLSADGSLPSVLRRLDARSSHPSGSFFVLTPEQALQVVPVMIMTANAFWVPVHLDAEPDDLG